MSATPLPDGHMTRSRVQKYMTDLVSEVMQKDEVVTDLNTVVKENYKSRLRTHIDAANELPFDSGTLTKVINLCLDKGALDQHVSAMIDSVTDSATAILVNRQERTENLRKRAKSEAEVEKLLTAQDDNIKVTSFSRINAETMADLGVSGADSPVGELNAASISDLKDKLAASSKRMDNINRILTDHDSGSAVPESLSGKSPPRLRPFDIVLHQYIVQHLFWIQTFIDDVFKHVGGQAEARARIPVDVLLLIGLASFWASIKRVMIVYPELKVAINRLCFKNSNLRSAVLQGKDHIHLVSGILDYGVLSAAAMPVPGSSTNEESDDVLKEFGAERLASDNLREVMRSVPGDSDPKLVGVDRQLSIFEVKRNLDTTRPIELASYLNQVQVQCIASMSVTSVKSMAWVLTDGQEWILGVTLQEKDGYRTRRYDTYRNDRDQTDILTLLAYWTWVEPSKIYDAMG